MENIYDTLEITVDYYPTYTYENLSNMLNMLYRFFYESLDIKEYTVPIAHDRVILPDNSGIEYAFSVIIATVFQIKHDMVDDSFLSSALKKIKAIEQNRFDILDSDKELLEKDIAIIKDYVQNK